MLFRSSFSGGKISIDKALEKAKFEHNSAQSWLLTIVLLTATLAIGREQIGLPLLKFSADILLAVLIVALLVFFYITTTAQFKVSELLSSGKNSSKGRGRFKRTFMSFATVVSLGLVVSGITLLVQSSYVSTHGWILAVFGTIVYGVVEGFRD